MLRRLVNLLRGRLLPRGQPAQPRPGVRPRPGGGVPPPAGGGQARDYDGRVALSYSPNHNHAPDPGEVVWTWVPYEEDSAAGKDRPVVVIGQLDPPGRSGELAVVMLSSQDHEGDPRWLVLGSGAWDGQDRVSSVRLDRVLAVEPAAVRREGATLDRDRFDQMTEGLRGQHGWR